MTRLVLLPGLAGDQVMWRAQVEHLAGWNPVIADVHMRFDTIAAMARALLDEQGGPLVLCGASMGGMIAMEAARQAPERVRGLALLGTTARPENDEMREVRENAIRLFEAGRLEDVIAPNVRFAFHPDNASPEITDAYLAFVLRAGPQQLIRQNRAVMARPDARPHLPRLRCPVLVMVGDADQLTTPEHSREIAALVPGCRLVNVPRCGHMLTMERPDLVNPTLASWLDALDLPRAQEWPAVGRA